MIIPIFLALALALPSWLDDALAAVPLASTLMPLIFAWTGYAFLFLFFPYTTVRYRPALIGSLITAVLWLTAYRMYVNLHTKPAMLRYGALAAISALLVWIYLSWSIVLFGAEIAAAAQYWNFGRKTRGDASRVRAESCPVRDGSSGGTDGNPHVLPVRL